MRRPDEPEGTTYGQRFRSSRGLPVEAPATAESRRVGDTLDEVLWRPLTQCRGSARWSAFELPVLAVVALRRIGPSWDALVRPARGVKSALVKSVSRLLTDIGGASPIEWHLWTEGQLAQVVRIVDLVVSPDCDGADSTGFAASADRAFRYLLNRFAAESADRAQEFFTPPSVVELLVELAAPTSGDSICDPCCGSGELLIGAARYARRHGVSDGAAYVHGAALDRRSRFVTALHAAVHGVHVGLGTGPVDLLRRTSAFDVRHDVMLTNPPFNRPWTSDHAPSMRTDWPYGRPPDHSGNFAWLQHAVSTLTENGRAVVVMPNSAASSQNHSERAIRTEMVRAGVVRCVVALPARLFHHTNVQVSIWVLANPTTDRREDVLFVDARSSGTVTPSGRRELADDQREQIAGAYRQWLSADPGAYPGHDGLAATATLNQIVGQNYRLDPSSYVRSAAPTAPDPDGMMTALHAACTKAADLDARTARANTRVQEYPSRTSPRATHDRLAEGWRTVPLGEVCDIRPGPSTYRPQHQASTGTPMLRPANVKNNQIVYDDLIRIDVKAARRMDAYRLQPGDIVCVRVGDPRRIALIEPEQEGWLLGDACLRLRPGKALLSHYLRHYLSLPAIRDWLVQRAQRTTIHSVSRAIMNELPVLLPPFDTQAEISTALDAMDAALEMEAARLQARTDLRHAYAEGLLTGVLALDADDHYT